jgi:hypothetical protein
MISRQDLSDLYVGDYFDKTITTALGTEKIQCQIAGFDCYLNTGDTELTQHHAVIVMKDCSKYTARMNDSDTTVGGYKGSEMFTTTIPKYVAGLENAFGNHLIARRALVTNAINDKYYNRFGTNSGATSGWEWVNEKAGLMSEAELYGSIHWSSSGHDNGEACIQLPLFALNPASRIARLGAPDTTNTTNLRKSYFLKSISSNNHFSSCGSDGNGISNYCGSSGSIGVRLRFLLG